MILAKPSSHEHSSPIEENSIKFLINLEISSKESPSSIILGSGMAKVIGSSISGLSITGTALLIRNYHKYEGIEFKFLTIKLVPGTKLSSSTQMLVTISILPNTSC